MLTNVDDLLFSESNSSGYAIADRTIDLLSTLYGDLRAEREPTSFNGYSIKRDRSINAITLTVGQKIIEAAREFMPELLDATEPQLSATMS